MAYPVFDRDVGVRLYPDPDTADQCDLFQTDRRKDVSLRDDFLYVEGAESTDGFFLPALCGRYSGPSRRKRRDLQFSYLYIRTSGAECVYDGILPCGHAEKQCDPDDHRNFLDRDQSPDLKTDLKKARQYFKDPIP